MARHDTHAVRVFDFRVPVDVGNDTVPSPLFTCATTLANAAWPYLSITPAPGNLGFGHRLDGHEDFDVLDQEFAEAFMVRTSDDRFATALLDVEMRRFLLDHARALDIEFNGAWAFAYAEHIPVELVPNVCVHGRPVGPRAQGRGRALRPAAQGRYRHTHAGSGHTRSDRSIRCGRDARRLRHPRVVVDRRLVSSVLGFNHSLPVFGYTGVASEAAELAMNEDIIGMQSWTDVESLILALDDLRTTRSSSTSMVTPCSPSARTLGVLVARCHTVHPATDA